MSIPAGRPQLAKLCREAQSNPEYATTALWECLFVFFPHNEYHVVSQQRPSGLPDDSRRVDLAVRTLSGDDGPPMTLLFLEAKRTGVSANIVQECELQALTAYWGVT